MYKKLTILLTAILMVGVTQAVTAEDCLEIDFEMTDTVYTTPGDFFVTGYFEMTNCGDMAARVWLESDSPIPTFGQVRGRVNLGAGETYVRSIHFPVPPPIMEGEYEICVSATVGDMVYEECQTLVVLKGMMEDKFARLQVIHNAADPGAEVVDVWVNDELFLDDFEFRTATPFVDVPAEVDLTIGVAGPGSMSADEALATFDFNLMEDETYVLTANGVLDPAGFQPNPDGMDIAFSLYPLAGAREMADEMDYVDFVAFHGATDAPTVDVIARDVATVVDDLTYGYYTDYVSVPADYYILDVTPGNDNNTVVASFEADLSGLGGGAAVVFASGFLTPADDQDGAAFGLFAALPDGNVVEFPMYMEEDPMARLQVIHNAADPGAEVVDIWVNDQLFLDDFEFRTATPFVDVPAGVDLTIGVAGPGSMSPGDALATFDVNLMEDVSYVAMASGVLDPAGFQPNPDGMDIAFSLYPLGDAREAAANMGEVEFVVFHGATDAPTVDVLARGVGPIVDDLTYGYYTDYLAVPAAGYILDITPGDDSLTIVASYDVDLSGLGGGAAVVFASGFLTPADDQDGAAFGLFAALPNGTVVEFPVYTEMTGLDGSDTPEITVNNYPNPFNPTTTISYNLPQAGHVTLEVYNVAGQKVRTLVDQHQDAGRQSIIWDGKDEYSSQVASGIYFYRIDTEDFSSTRKMVLLK